MNKDEVLRKIANLKMNNFGEYFVDCNYNGLDYKLILLTKDSVDNADVMELLFRWRKNNQVWFQAQFNITLEGTVKWFRDRVIGAPDRILFIIKVGDKYVGHVGLFRFDFVESACELDNVLRGENIFPGIISAAIVDVFKWGKDVLGIEKYTLETFSDSVRALKMYEKLGFREYKRIPLIKIHNGDRTEWVEPSSDYQGGIERFNIFMKLV